MKTQNDGLCEKLPHNIYLKFVNEKWKQRKNDGKHKIFITTFSRKVSKEEKIFKSLTHDDKNTILNNIHWRWVENE